MLSGHSIITKSVLPLGAVHTVLDVACLVVALLAQAF